METEEFEFEEEEPKRKKKHSIVFRLVLILVLLLIGFLGFEAWYWFDCQKAVSSVSETVEFPVEEGATMYSVTEDLKDAGLVKNSKITYYYAKLNDYSDVYVGVYTLDKNMDLDAIFQTLEDPTAAVSQSDVTITIIEGDWAKHIAEKITEVTNVSYDELIALWSNADWIRSQMSTYPFLTEEMFNDGVRIYLEGYFAPNTYELDEDWTAEEITQTILNQTLAIYNEYSDLFAQSTLSVHQIYTLASIVQYEGGTDSEVLKNIASVFYNRMSVGMPLQSSVTVCYAIDFDNQTDSWQACEINTSFDSPYNTYLYTGLPPGAIENAGIEALEAVLNPNQTNYYYFMADVYGDGTVYFSETLEEHNALVQKYLYGG